MALTTISSLSNSFKGYSPIEKNGKVGEGNDAAGGDRVAKAEKEGEDLEKGLFEGEVALETDGEDVKMG